VNKRAKVWALPAEEDWICDRLVSEFVTGNPDIAVGRLEDANIIWLLSDWRWRHVPWDQLSGKTVVTTVHHIVPEKFGPADRRDFEFRDKVTDAYHVYNQRTYDTVRGLTMKPVRLIPYWANGDLFHPSQRSKSDVRSELGLPADDFIIGSFQRDTEGRDLRSPKLEKGPDLFCDAVEAWVAQGRSDGRRISVALGGWRRQYVIGRLQAAGIPFCYLERPPIPTLIKMYEAIDLYPVTARHEGGPQALLECGMMGVPVVSRPVGIAEQVLPTCAIHEDVTQAYPMVPRVDRFLIPSGFEAYRSFFQELL